MMNAKEPLQTAPQPSRSGERGQTMIFAVLGLGLVFLAVLGFAVDFGNMWFHRQRAQAAADAACTAAVMDVLYNVNNSPTTPVGGFTTGTAFNCSSAAPPPSCSSDPNASSNPSCSTGSGSGPCQYAALNGYSGTGLVANSESNKVEITFPSTIAGIDPFSSLGPGDATVPPSNLVPQPFIHVRITDRIPSGFFGLVSASRTLDVPAVASCAILATTSPIPLLVLKPQTSPPKPTFVVDGGAGLKVWGGPPVSIQVNSSDSKAISVNGGGLVDLSKGGADNKGSTLQVDGWPQTSNPAPISTTATCDPTAQLCLGTAGQYTQHARITDPLAAVTAPNQPTALLNRSVATTLTYPSVQDQPGKLNLTHGCPAPSGKVCNEFLPGYYANGINLSAGAGGYYAIFAPGIYYIKNGMSFGAHVCVRPSFNTGDGSGGTFFYFVDNNSVNVQSGGCTDLAGTDGPNYAPAVQFTTLTTSGDAPYQYGVACDATSYAGLPSNIDNPIRGSVLLAPCTGPTVNALCDATPTANCGLNGGNGWGDQLGASDPHGLQRGILFMQNRGINPGAASNQPRWTGGGAFLLSGAMYFHQCHTVATQTDGGGCDNTNAFNDQFTLGGNSSGNSYVLGNVIVDYFNVHGTPNFYLDLSPYAQYITFKASLVQ